MDNQYDLTVIGGGPGGYVAAIRAAQLGLKTAVVEEHEFGGTCLNWGCIPTKTLLHSAELYHTSRRAADFGVLIQNVDFDYARIAERKDSVVRQLRKGVESLVKGHGVAIIRGRAFIRDKNTLEITGRDAGTISTGKIIIATGSRPAKPPIPGIDGEKVLDSNDVLALSHCPEKLVIIGGGVIGVEFATLFNSLGKQVTIIEMMDVLLPGTDSDLSSALSKSFEKKGVRIFTGSKVTSIRTGSSAVCVFASDGREQEASGDIIIVATGRKPNSENLGLENLGLETERGFIRVNGKMETTVQGVYAIGDVTGKVLLAHAASAQGLAAAANAAGKDVLMDYSVIPSCIYTSPEIASVGLSESDAIIKGHYIKIGKFPVSSNGKSMIMGESEGFFKLITDSNSGEILGAHLMGPRATDMISGICVAMKLESTIEEIADTVHPHPTISEMIMESAHDVEKMCVHKYSK